MTTHFPKLTMRSHRLGFHYALRRLLELQLLSGLTPVGAFILIIAIVGTGPHWADYDIFWHLANGRLMVERGIFPSPDPFSWTMGGKTYVDYSAQVDRLFYLLWQLGGAQLLGLAASLFFALALLPYVLLVGSHKLRPSIELAALLLLLLVMLPFRGARPHVIAFALFGVVIYLLERPFGVCKGLVAGLILGLWANIHGSFQVVFAVIAIAGCLWLWQRNFHALRGVALALTVGFAMSLLSPYGFRLWLYPFQTVSNPYASRILEWQSLHPLSVFGAPAGAILLLAMITGLWHIRDARSIAALALVLPSIQLLRLTPFAMPLLIVVTIDRVAERLPHLQVQPGIRMFAMLYSRRARAASCTLLLLTVILLPWKLPSKPEIAGLYAPEELPTAAVDHLLACGAPAPVWNDYDWGGYLLWRGGGSYTIGMDGRAETLYSNQVMDRYFQVFDRREGWQALLNASAAQYMLVRTNSMGASDTLPGWHQVFTDHTATLVVRNSAVWRCIPQVQQMVN